MILSAVKKMIRKKKKKTGNKVSGRMRKIKMIG